MVLELVLSGGLDNELDVPPFPVVVREQGPTLALNDLDDNFACVRYSRYNISFVYLQGPSTPPGPEYAAILGEFGFSRFSKGSKLISGFHGQSSVGHGDQARVAEGDGARGRETISLDLEYV